MKKENKENSINYWDKNAENWQNMAYDKQKLFLNFPSSQQRQDITVSAIKKLAKNKKASIIDIGCADGDLISALVKLGFSNLKGIDNSKKMIAAAKAKIKKSAPSLNAHQIFFVDDADHLSAEQTFDFVSAMGLIEYLLDVEAFFEKVNSILKPGGYAFIESRNKLFNVFSANQYTLGAPIKDLVEQLKYVAQFSSIQDDKQIESIVQKTYISIGENLKDVELPVKIEKAKKFDKFPFDLPQYTPKEIAGLCKKHNLLLKFVIYYHPHAFLPRFQNNFPALFNQIALNMQPLGYTPLGATICSSFVAVIKKTK